MEAIGQILFGFFGLTVLVGIAYLFSTAKKSINWTQVLFGLLLQIAFAIFILESFLGWGKTIFEMIAGGFVQIINFTYEGSQFVLGFLALQSEVAKVSSFSGGFVFVFQVLPTIIFFASLMAVLYHLGVMQKVVQGMAWVMSSVLRISGAESISVAANVFIGQTEAPLVVRPYVSSMTKSELYTLMVGGMATIAGGVLAAYVGILGGNDPELSIFYAKHLLSASIMAAPATIVISKILIPETGQSQTLGIVNVPVEKSSSNIIEAAASGASDGMKLALNVAAMLLAFIALIAMVNWVLEGVFTDMLGLSINGAPVTMQVLLGYLLSPIAWVIGVPWEDAVDVGSLIGQKVVINEFVAYLSFNDIKDLLDEKSVVISTYALCGFANFSSIAIQIGGIGGIAPDRKSDIAKLGLKAVLGGSLATFMTATIAGVITGFF
jgi:CNT family concentrative nucleoside transporter